MSKTLTKVCFYNNRGKVFFTANELDIWNASDFRGDVHKFFVYSAGVDDTNNQITMCGLLPYAKAFTSSTKMIRPSDGEVLLRGFVNAENDGIDDFVTIYPGGVIKIFSLSKLLEGNTKPDCRVKLNDDIMQRLERIGTVLTKHPYLTPWTRPEVRFWVTNYGNKVRVSVDIIDMGAVGIGDSIIHEDEDVKEHKQLHAYDLIKVIAVRRNKSWILKEVIDNTEKVLDPKWQFKWINKRSKMLHKAAKKMRVPDGAEPAPEKPDETQALREENEKLKESINNLLPRVCKHMALDLTDQPTCSLLMNELGGTTRPISRSVQFERE